MRKLSQYKKIKPWQNLFNFSSKKSFYDRFNALWQNGKKKKKIEKTNWEKTKALFSRKPNELPLLPEKNIFRDFKVKIDSHKNQSKLLKEFDEIKKKLEGFNPSDLPEEVQDRAQDFYDMAVKITERKPDDFDKALEALDMLLVARDLYLSSLKKN